MSKTFLDLVMEDSQCTTLTICGSYRFRKLKEQYQAYYTLQNNLVFIPINYNLIKNSMETHVGAPERNAKVMADIHDKKIDLSDAIIVVVGEEIYVGSDTRREIVYAFQNAKRILFTNVPEKDKDKYYFNHNLAYPLYMPKEEYLCL